MSNRMGQERWWVEWPPRNRRWHWTAFYWLSLFTAALNLNGMLLGIEQFAEHGYMSQFFAVMMCPYGALIAMGLAHAADETRRRHEV